MKLLSLFSGIGAFEKALQRLKVDYDLVGFCEIDKYAIQSYCAIHSESEQKNLGDISRVDPSAIPDFDLMTYGFPCFSKDTLITTNEGIKLIQDIEKGDKVLTHTNTFKEVKNTMINKKKGIYRLKVQGSPYTLVTEEHPYYVRHKKRIWNNSKRGYDVFLSTPTWKNVKDLRKGDLVGFSNNQNSINEKNLSKEECWLLGRYIADGYCQDGKRVGRTNSFNNKVTFCVGKKKINEFRNKVDEYYVGVSEERTVYKCRIVDKRFLGLSKFCGRGAINKRIPQFILDLPVKYLKEFLEGYMSGDGCFTNKVFKASSISKILIYQLGQVISKVYNTPYSIYYYKRPKTTIIEGRKVNQHDTWTITFQKIIKKQNNAVYKDGYLWCPVTEFEYLPDYNDNTYNFEVEEDNSYTANNCIVHNCTDISVAGQQKGFKKGSGTRSGLLWNAMNILEHKKPKYAIAENVRNLVSKKFMPDFKNWLLELEALGYNNYWQILNSKDFNIPQSRDRVFIISIRKDINKEFIFPNTVRPITKLKDLLETEVDEQYYISKEKTIELLKQLKVGKIGINPCLTPDRVNKRQNGRRFKENGEPSFTLTGQDKHGILKVLDLPKDIVKDNERQRRVYSKDGVSPSLLGRSDSPKIAEDPIMLHNIYGGFKEKKPRVFKDYSPTIRTAKGGGHIPSVLSKYELSDKELKYMNRKTKDGRNHWDFAHHQDSNKDVANTLVANLYKGVPYNVIIDDRYKGLIRKLTPLECFRLMGFDDEDYLKCKASGLSNTQLYKQAGNSIVVNVLQSLLKNLLDVKLKEGS